MSETARDESAALAEQFEGFSATVYPDPGTGAEPWTQGYGSTRGDDGQPLTPQSPPITRAKAVEWLQRDMSEAFVTIASAVTVPLTDNESAALADFIYNLGSGAFIASTLLRLLNAGDYAGAADQLLLWDHAGARVMAGLLRRREAEKTLFKKR